jgi:hypothetical protein
MRKLPATDRKRELDVASAQAGQAGQVRFVTSDVLSHAQRVMQHLWAEPVQVESL